MSWGSLRGALAIVMVLLIPDNLTLPGWTFSFSIKDFIAALTIGCIYFTLLVKATSIGFFIRKLKIDALSSHEELSYFKTKAMIYQVMLNKLNNLLANKQISTDQHKALSVYYQTLHDQQVVESKQVFADPSPIIEGMLRLYALGLEKAELKDNFRRGEINEAGYKKILTMLEIQVARVEQEKRQLTSLNEHFSDWFYIPFINFFRRALFLKPKMPDPGEVYLYYRTQYKMITKIIDELSKLENSRLYEVFDDKPALDNVLAVFTSLQATTEDNMKNVIKSNQLLLDRLNQKSVRNLLEETLYLTLTELHTSEIITTKLYISLKKEIKLFLITHKPQPSLKASLAWAVS